MIRRRACFALVLLLAGAGCVGEEVRESAETVLTLQSGTMSELRDRRGAGPFTTYDVPPAEMLGLVEAAARKARGADGSPVRAIFVSERRGEVVAKERAGEHADSTAYEPPFRTAMLAVVHPVPGRPDVSRLEVHEISRGPFHQGVVRWRASMPGWIEEVRAERAAAEDAPLAPIR